MATPNNTATTIKIVFRIPSVPNDSFIKIVDMIYPEFRITIQNLSVCKSENKSRKTSVNIKIVKKSSKNILFTSAKNELTKRLREKKLS